MAAQVDFEWQYNEEPHKTRRQEIKKKYPQISELEGYDPRSKWIVLVLVAAQMAACHFLRDVSWPVRLFVAYAFGGTVNHALSLSLHELSHNLLFDTKKKNEAFSLFANLPLGIPSAMTFKRYHLEHHRFQGEDGVDVDIPTEAEVRFFTTVPRKILFVLMQPLFYAIRPMFVRPKDPTMREMLNWVTQLTFDAFVYYYFGAEALAYLVISSLLGMGLHPVAGHFIAEHYVFMKGQETYSYYGPLNWLTFNVGYHNEHHDFPRIPGLRLPQVRQMAPEFYDSMPYHTSWVKVIFDYIMDPTIGPHSRVKRRTKAGIAAGQVSKDNTAE